MQLKRVSATRWNSTEAAVDTVMSRYSEILCTSDQLSDPSSNDSETITAAVGLTKRLKDIRVIMCKEVLKIVYRVIGPLSRQLQGTYTDLAMEARLLEDKGLQAPAKSSEHGRRCCVEDGQSKFRSVCFPSWYQYRISRRQTSC